MSPDIATAQAARPTSRRRRQSTRSMSLWQIHPPAPSSRSHLVCWFAWNPTSITTMKTHKLVQGCLAMLCASLRPGVTRVHGLAPAC